GHYVHRALGRVVPGEAGTGPDARRRADVDDGTILALAHDGHDRLRHVIDRLDVDVEDAIEGGLIDVEHPLVAVRRAGIVDDDVRRTERIDTGLHRGVHLGAFGHVALLRFGVRAERRCHRLRLRSVQIDDQHARALGDKALGDAFAKATGGTG